MGVARLTTAEVKAVITAKLPAIDQHDEVVDQVGDDELHIRTPFRGEYLGTDTWQNSSGLVYSGPMVMGLADTAMYACLHGAYGREITPVIVSLTITFLEPALPCDLIARARIVRKGGRLVYLDTKLFSDGSPRPIAHVTATYAVQQRR